jgi:uncharacterized protein
MSKGLSPKLPLSKDQSDGYALNKDYSEMIIQNLKMLLLTAPGERMMEPAFGVGLRNYLFENNTTSTYATIEVKIREQISFYLPFVEVVAIDFNPMYAESGTNENGLSLNMRFRIVPLDISTSLEIEVGTN